MDQGPVGLRPRRRGRPGPAPVGRPDRLRQPLPGAAAGVRADRRHHRGGAEHRATAPSTSTRWPPALEPGRVALAALTHVGTHRGPGQSGRRGRGGLPAGRGPVLPRRLPERRPAPGRRATASAATWPPPPGANGCAGPGAPGSSSSGPLRRAAPPPGHRLERGPVGGRRPLPARDRAPTGFVRVRGPGRRPPRAWGWPSTTRWPSGIDAIAERVVDLAERLRRPRRRRRAWRSTTAAPRARAS